MSHSEGRSEERLPGNGEIEDRLERTLQREVPAEIGERLRGRVETFARSLSEPSTRSRKRRPIPLLRPALAAMGLVACVLTAVALRRPALEYWHMSKLDSEDEAVREAAAERLGAMRSERAIPRLIALLREASAAQIQMLEDQDGAMPALTDLGSWSWPVPLPAAPLNLHFSARALIAIGPPAVPALVELLEEPDRGAGKLTAYALAAIGPPARESLLELLTATEPHVRSLASAALGVHGRVVDHRGEPVAGARVFLASRRMWYVDGENAYVPQQQQQQQKLVRGGTTALGFPLLSRSGSSFSGFEQTRDAAIRTDEEGRFVLHGAIPEDNRVLVMADGLQAWVARAPDLREEVTVELPRPAVAVLRYAPGKGPEISNFQLALVLPRDGLWDRSLRSLKREAPVEIRADGSGGVTLEGLAPGTYRIGHSKSIDFGNFGKYGFSVETGSLVELKAGETTLVDLRPEDGVTVAGEVLGLDEQLPVSIQVLASGSRTPIDVTGRIGNGRFEFPALAPGTYEFLAESMPVPLTRTRTWTPSRTPSRPPRRPSFVGRTTVTVTPATGKPVEIEIELRSLPEPPSTESIRSSSSGRRTSTTRR